MCGIFGIFEEDKNKDNLFYDLGGLSESRGKGIGSKLVNKLVDDARSWYKEKGGSIRKLYLFTHEDNLGAHNFYEKIGFKHESTLENHYYTGKDERVYSMFFPNE